MAMRVVKIEGLKEFERQLKRLEQREAKKIVRASNQKAMLPTLQAARQNVPVESGALRRSLKRQTKAYPSGVVLTRIGADRRVVATDPATGETRQPYRYLHLVEFGTRRVAPKRPLQRAHESTEAQVFAAHKRIMREKLTKAATS